MVRLFSTTVGAVSRMLPVATTERNTSGRGMGLAPGAGACTSLRFTSTDVTLYVAVMGVNELTLQSITKRLSPIRNFAPGILAVFIVNVAVPCPSFTGLGMASILALTFMKFAVPVISGAAPGAIVLDTRTLALASPLMANGAIAGRRSFHGLSAVFTFSARFMLLLGGNGTMRPVPDPVSE